MFKADDNVKRIRGSAGDLPVGTICTVVKCKGISVWLKGYTGCYNKSYFELVPEVDPFAELKQALADGKIIQLFNCGDWVDVPADLVGWARPDVDYRIKPEPAKPHVHAELIHAWVADPTIVFQRNNGTGWVDQVNPHWWPSYAYRIKPSAEDLAKVAELENLLKLNKTELDLVKSELRQGIAREYTLVDSIILTQAELVKLQE